jgi:hypothetical protein
MGGLEKKNQNFLKLYILEGNTYRFISADSMLADCLQHCYIAAYCTLNHGLAIEIDYPILSDNGLCHFCSYKVVGTEHR